MELLTISVMENLDQRLKDLDRANSTAMSDPSAKEDITDVGDMVIESDGDAPDSFDRTANNLPALPSAPPPLPPPPPPTPPISEDSSSALSGPGMIMTPPTGPSYSSVQQFQPQGEARTEGSDYSGIVQSARMPTASTNVYRQPQLRYEQPYATGRLLGPYNQPRARQMSTTEAGGRGEMRALVRGRRVMLRPRVAFRPRYSHPIPLSSPGMSVRAPSYRYPLDQVLNKRPRGLPPRLRVPLRALPPQPQATEYFGANSAFDEPDSVDEFSSNIPAAGDPVQYVQPTDAMELPQKVNPFELVKEMLTSINKKKLNKNNSEEIMNHKNANTLPAASQTDHVTTATPHLYGKPRNDSATQGVGGDRLSQDHSTEGVLIEVKGSLSSLSSESPTEGPLSAPNMDNPILQALYSSQDSPKDHHHPPSALDLLRDEDSDQEDELTSSDLKNILNQVKCGDSPSACMAVNATATGRALFSAQPPPGDPGASSNDGAALAVANIPITPRLNNLLEQIFPEISQPHSKCKRRQGDQQEESCTPTSPDAKVPCIAGHQPRHFGPPQAQLPARSTAGTPAHTLYRPGVRYSSPRVIVPLSPHVHSHSVEHPCASIYASTDEVPETRGSAPRGLVYTGTDIGTGRGPGPRASVHPGSLYAGTGGGPGAMVSALRGPGFNNTGNGPGAMVLTSQSPGYTSTGNGPGAMVSAPRGPSYTGRGPGAMVSAPQGPCYTGKGSGPEAMVSAPRGPSHAIRGPGAALRGPSYTSTVRGPGAMVSAPRGPGDGPGAMVSAPRRPGYDGTDRMPGAMVSALRGPRYTSTGRGPGAMVSAPRRPGYSSTDGGPAVRISAPRGPSYAVSGRMPAADSAPQGPGHAGPDGETGGGPGGMISVPMGPNNQPAMGYRYGTPSLGAGAIRHPRGSRVRIMFQPGTRTRPMPCPPPPHDCRPMWSRHL